MPRKVKSHILPHDSATERLTPKHLTKQEFGRRVYRLMNAKGWIASELARQAGLNRDAISTYINGKTLPTPSKLAALARALGVAPEELLPNQIEATIDTDPPALEIKVSTSAPNTAWIRVNRLVTMDTAVKIAALLQADDAIDRIGSSAAA